MKGIDFPALSVFVAAVEERSLTKAADRENLVTSAVSKRITDLEHYLGKALLHRNGRGVEPTSAGMLLYQRAKALLRNVRATEQAISVFDADGYANIKLAAVRSIVSHQLPRQMAQFLAGRENTSVDLLEGISCDIPRMVVDGEVDLGIYHAAYPAPGVRSYPYVRDRIGLVVPVGHPLAASGSLYFEEALEYDLIGYFPRHSLDAFLAYAESSFSRPPKVKLQVINIEARCRMVSEGLGIALVPEHIAVNYLASMGLVLLALHDAWAHRQFFICIDDRPGHHQAVNELLFMLRNTPAPD
jgi:DNA-binding transcriptional LysR family regulator